MSVSQYLDVLKKHDLQYHYSRGENTKYPSIIAKGFRVSGGLKGDRVSEKYKNLMDEFSRIAYGDLSDIQRTHFIAFCQHYGLPTNLIDFTESPLISLFFACYAKPIQSQVSNGYIYFIDKTKTYDLTSEIAKNNHISLDEMFYFVETQEHVCPLAVVENSLFPFLRDNIKKFNLSNDHVRKHKCPSDNRHIISLAQKYASVHSMAKYISDNWERLEHRRGIHYMAYIMLLDLETLEKPFELPVLYMYKPPAVVQRISVQHSVFLYQFKNSVWRDDNPQVVQKVTPFFTIEVDGKKKSDILKDLDYLGINIKTVFGDYDHVAEYIVEKNK
jgi:hypothetical protein